MKLDTAYHPPKVIVIGGGTAGLMAAIGAGQAGAKVTLLEKGDRLGRKLLISGGGRCNVTNSRGVSHIIENTPGNGRFLHSVYAQWSNQEIIDFFNERGVELKEEDHGRLFPATNKSSTILQALIAEIHQLNIEVVFHSSVHRLLMKSGQVEGVETDRARIKADAVVIATGGVCAPATGSTGDGYVFAKSAGHHIVDPYPTSVPITSKAHWVQDGFLQGIALRGVQVALFENRKRALAREEGDLLFTHFGLSGPVALRLSQYLVKARAKNPDAYFDVQIDFFPDSTSSQLVSEIWNLFQKESRKGIKHILKRWMPERLATYMAEGLKAHEKPTGEWSKLDVEDLVVNLKGWSLQVHGTLGFDKAFVTGGGIATKEVNPKTLASKLVDGLYFAGEILDIHAHTGGYNITAAFATGYLAGQCAALEAKERGIL